MKLTKEQIAKIDNKLASKGLVYEDIKLELLDHIASDTENVMIDKEIAFEIAFKEAFKKWKPQLKEESNAFWLPIWKKGPKLFIDKWAEQSKKQFLYSFLILIVTSFLAATIIVIYKNYANQNIIEKIYKAISFSVMVLLILGRIFIFKSKIKTTFGSMYNVKFIVSIMWLIIELVKHRWGFDSRFSFSEVFLEILLGNYFLALAILPFRLLYKHFEFERKLSKV